VLWVHNLIGRGAAILNKDHPGVAAINDWIMGEYEGGRTTAISDTEMLALVKDHLRDWIKESGFDL